MNRSGKTLLFAIAAALLMTGCATVNVNVPATDDGDNDAAETSLQEDQDAAAGKEEDADAGNSESNMAYDDPASLPAYSYTGDDPYLGVINDYLIDYEKRAGALECDIYIPFSTVVQVDDKDPGDIIAYGAYNIDGYDLLNTTLFSVTGSRSTGAIHLQTNEDGSYTVTDADLPLVSEESEKVFAPVPGLFDRVNELMDKDGDKMRDDAVADYVSANGLNITQWQDYGHDPVQVAGAEPTPEEAQFYTFNSPVGYQLTYDLRQLSASSSDDEDMYARVEKEWTGTLMVIGRAEGADADAALTAALSDTDAGSVTGKDSVMAGTACRRAEHDEVLEDGRIFRYVCYAIPAGDGFITVTIETTVEKGVSEMSAEQLEQFFEPTLATFKLQ